MNHEDTIKIRDILSTCFKRNIGLNTFSFYAPVEAVDDDFELFEVPENWIKEVYKTNKGIYRVGNKFFVEYYDELALEEIVGSLNDINDKLFVNKILKVYEKDREDLIADYEKTKTRINSLLKEVAKECNERDKIFVKMNYENNVKKIKEKIESSIALIKKHKNFDKLYIKENILGICAKDLIIYEEVSERYFWVGNVRIEINTSYGTIYFYSDENNKKGYWNNMQFHPHIDGHGEACYGDSDAAFATQLAEKEFYGLYLTAINFLQSVNVNDVAGYAVSYWDECDEDGNIIKEGHCPEENEYGFSNYDDSMYYKRQYESCTVECNICGSEIDEDDSYTCEDCGIQVCVDCINEINTPYGTEFICDDCLEKYVFCSDTERYVLREDAHYIEEDEVWHEYEGEEE